MSDSLRTTNKDVNKWLKELRKRGWTVERRGNTHLRVTNTEGISIAISNTCSDHRGMLNVRADLRRLGASI